MPNVMFVSTQNYEVLLRYKLCYHIKPDHPANFYILQEKKRKITISLCLCNGMTDLHTSWYAAVKYIF